MFPNLLFVSERAPAVDARPLRVADLFPPVPGVDRATDTGRRLERLLGGWPDHLVNLLPPGPGWPELEARVAGWLVREYALRQKLSIVALGRRAARALRLPQPDPGQYGPVQTLHGPALLLPHPSGRCRALNDPDLRKEVPTWAHALDGAAAPATGWSTR